MTAGEFKSRGVMAAAAAAIGSSLLGFLILVLTGQIAVAGMRNPLTELPVVAAIVLFWVPAFAFVPAAILGWFVERPKARKFIARGSGGLGLHLALSVAAALLLWLLLRIALYATSSTPQLMDAPSLILIGLVGLCSGIAWWFMLVEPGRRR